MARSRSRDYPCAQMWNDTPLDPPHACESCKRNGTNGPFWHGPVRPTGQAGMFGPIEGRVILCAACLFVAINAPESPYHGKIPAADAAAELEAGLRAEIDKLKLKLSESQAQAVAAAPDTIAQAAVAAAISELEARGAIGGGPSMEAEAPAPAPAADIEPQADEPKPRPRRQKAAAK